MTMNITRVTQTKAACGMHSIDHFALCVPDLAVAKHFYDTFGLQTAERDGVLTLSTAHADHVWGQIHAGDEKQLAYLCLNCHAKDFQTIVEQVKQAGGLPAQAWPQALHDGGFWFFDPDGNLLQLRIGKKTTPTSASAIAPLPRANAQRGVLGRSVAHTVRPLRLSHVLLFAADVPKQVDFYARGLGLGLSDRSRDIIAFMHGVHGSDHHLIAFAKSHGRGWHHAAWDVASVEDVGLGYMQMQDAGYTQAWGVGRHVLGSNYFCYMRDPWGSYNEYSAHIDFVGDGQWDSADYPPEDSLYLWGPALPEDFITNTEQHPPRHQAAATA